MKRILLFCGIISVANSACNFCEAADDGNSSALKNAVILIIRHAEEAEDSYGLSSVGEARAGAYVNYFKNYSIDGQPLKLDYLFAAKDTPNSHRPRLTIEPTAEALGLTVDSRFKNNKILELAHEIKSEPPGANFLICWHHRNIARLLRALGAEPEQLLPHGKWPGDVFGWLIELRYGEQVCLKENASTKICK